MKKGAAHATINRALAAIKRAFHLAAQCTPPKVGMIPFIPMLRESNARKGFFEKEDFLKLRAALPSYLRPILTFGYMYGWRKGEITNLTWENVDLNQGIVRLNPGETKNDEAREVSLNEECLRDFTFLFATRGSCKYVFHRKGHKIGDFRKAWETACRKAGLGGRLFHDLRRTAVRNLVRSGVPERIAMKITGHRTREVFDRYNIVNQDDIRGAVDKLQRFYENVTIDPKEIAKGLVVVEASA